MVSVTKELSVDMYPLGENAIMVEFGKCIHPDINRKVMALVEYLDQHPFEGMLEYISAYKNVTIFYDPLLVNVLPIEVEAGEMPLSYRKMVRFIEEALKTIDMNKARQASIVELPVCYGGEFGPDLAFVAKHNQLSTQEVIDIHSSGEYLVYMIGFAPGFPFLGGMSEKIATPRRSSPRLAIPVGSVGIAGSQTGAYPIETPGGWQLIGRTPVELFCPQNNPPTLLDAGNVVKFKPITLDEYNVIRGAKK